MKIAIESNIPTPPVLFTAEKLPALVRSVGERHCGGTIIAVRIKRRTIRYTVRFA